MSRTDDLIRLYAVLDRLKVFEGGSATLANLSGRSWPARGVYFFFDQSEPRSDTGAGPRIVRIGTHGLGEGSVSTLRQRLSQHRGSSKGEGGNHRGSIFRLLVGEAMHLSGLVPPCASWGVKGDPKAAALKLGLDRTALLEEERATERAVSSYLGKLDVVYLAVDDEPGPRSMRGFVERNSIALVSNLKRSPIDPPSMGWLGLNSGRLLVRGSGLWNQRHVADEYDPNFIEVLSTLTR